MKKTFLIALVFGIMFFSMTESKAQIAIHSLGGEAQIYPTGYLLGLRAEVSLADHHSGDIRIGANIFDHRDFGVQDTEEGNGFGFTLGYRYYFSPDKTKWFVGARNDLWWNTVDWQSMNTTTLTILEGTTEIFVIQPTAIVGYVLKFGDHFLITPTAAFGFEVNANTRGEPTGEGPIVLGGINISYKF